MNFQEMFSQVPDRPEPSEPLVEHTIKWTLNRLKEQNYEHLEVELSGKVAYAVVKALRTYLEPKGYTITIALSQRGSYKVTID